eukprot:XP_001708097.1 Hypothetical protein GL50803_37102 [Giardia lamblia ATCC 50803]
MILPITDCCVVLNDQGRSKKRAQDVEYIHNCEAIGRQQKLVDQG